MPLAKVFLSSVVSKAKVALCSDATHCHRADLLRYTLWLGCGEGAARRTRRRLPIQGGIFGDKKGATL